MPRLQSFGVPLADLAQPTSSIDQAIAAAVRQERAYDGRIAREPVIEGAAVPSMSSVRLPKISDALRNLKAQQ